MKFLAIKGYWNHQHYHKRGAPWIKLYASVLSDAAFIQLPETAQAQLMKLWIITSQLGHPLPNNPKLLAGKIGTTGKFQLAGLIAAGFVIPCETEDEAAIAAGRKNASNLLAESPQNATGPSREIEGEVEKHLLPRPQAELDAEAELAGMLDTDADRTALTVVVTRAIDRIAWLTALKSILTGNDPACPQPTSAVFGQALRDMAANGAPATARKIRNYVAEADGRGITTPITRRANTVAQRTFDNGKRALEGM
jgi:hypothetical protein